MVEIRGLRKRYRRSDPYAVDGVSLRIEAGQVFGLLGPNGAGKSTIVKMIAGGAPRDKSQTTRLYLPATDRQVEQHSDH